jgi:hypothetical protein
MTLSVWLWALAWAGLVFAIVVWAAVMIDKMVQLHLPHPMVWFWAGLGACIAASVALTLWRKPSKRQAAVAIDEQLLLKEKFSTALYIRPSRDPFAMAAVRDAEQTADRVNLQSKFPIRYPKAANATIVAAILVFLTVWLVPTLDLFGVEAGRVARSEAAKQEQQQARETVLRAIKVIDSAPKAIAQRADIQLAKRELLAMHGKPTLDPEAARGTAEKAVENIEKAIKEKIDANKDFAVKEEEMKEFKNLTPPIDETGPMADAQRNLAAGKVDQAVEKIADAVNKFDKMSKQDKEKAAKQTDNMAKKLQQMANDPKVQQQVKDQLQKMGASQPQIQNMQNLMKQAAAGNQQAAKQVQNLAKQLAQQANQNGKMSPQQQRQVAQQVQNTITQLQQKVNTQINAQQLAQSAQALATAMKQSAQGGNPGQPQQGNQGQQASNQGAQQQPKQGNQPGQQGNKPGQGNQQQMANAAQQMQKQLQQMQAVANDAQQVAANQPQPGQDGQDGNNQNDPNGQNGNQPGNGQQGNAGGQKPWGQGQPNPQNNGQVQGQGPGVGAGNNRPSPTETPFGTKNETDILQKDEKGKVLASSFVKAGSIRGDAKMNLHDVLPPVDKEATDEVGEQRIPRQDQDVVRGYFGNLEKDTQKK